MASSTDNIPPVTPQSIHDAQIAMWKERRQCEREMHVLIDKDGHIKIKKERA
jgi:hypothetical protein